MGVFAEKSGLVEFPSNRYEVLTETKKLFDMNHVDSDQVFGAILNSTDGLLAYRFGDITIILSRDSERPENSICLSIEEENEGMHRRVSFEYEIGNLGLLRKRRETHGKRLGGG